MISKTSQIILEELFNEDQVFMIKKVFEQELATLKKQADCGYDHTHGVTCKKCGWEYNA